MVVSRLPLPAGCRVDASTSRPLDSASGSTSAYQRPATSCPLVHFFPMPLFDGWLSRRLLVCRLPLALPFVAQPPLASILGPRVFVRASWLLRRILSHRLRLSTGRRLTCCFLRHLHLTSTRSHSLTPPFPSPLLSAPRPSAIAGVLKCTVHSPGGGIANGHCSVSYGSRPPTCPPARQLTCCLLQHLHLNPPARPLSHRHFHHPLSRRRGHRRRPQMHGAPSGGGIANGHCSLSHGYMATLACAVLDLLSRTANNKM
jgi:hypothetical protein